MELELTPNPAYQKKCKDASSKNMYKDKLCALFTCPDTSLEMSGMFHFLLNFTSGKDDAPVPKEAAYEPMDIDDHEDVGIWGTDVSVKQCKAKMAKFAQQFANPKAANDKTFLNKDAGAPYHLQRLEEIAVTEESFLPINCGHIQQFDEDL